MISFPEESKLRDIRSFTADELDNASSRGWQLIAIVQEKNVSNESRQIPCPGGNNNTACRHGNYNSCYSSDYMDQPMEFTVTKYVMGRDKDTVVGDLTAQVEQLQADCNEHQAELYSEQARANKLEEQVASWQKIHKGAEKEIGTQIKLREDLENRVKGHLETITKMEADLGKLREYFGSAAVKEALAK